MYTMIQILSVGGIILSIVLTTILGVMFLMDMGVPKEHKVVNFNPKIFLILGFVLVLSFFALVWSDKNLSEQTCEINGGTFKSWDSGFDWACYNPDQIEQNNNFRVVTDD